MRLCACGRESQAAGLGIRTSVRSACLLSGDEEPVQTRPVGLRCTINYTHYRPQECYPSQTETILKKDKIEWINRNKYSICEPIFFHVGKTKTLMVPSDSVIVKFGCLIDI